MAKYDDYSKMLVIGYFLFSCELAIFLTYSFYMTVVFYIYYNEKLNKEKSAEPWEIDSFEDDYEKLIVQISSFFLLAALYFLAYCVIVLWNGVMKRLVKDARFWYKIRMFQLIVLLTFGAANTYAYQKFNFILFGVISYNFSTLIFISFFIDSIEKEKDSGITLDMTQTFPKIWRIKE